MAIAGFALSGHAVIVYGPDGNSPTYTTAPEGDAGSIWDYVGNNGASAVYLGDYNGTYWVLTAAHVGAGSTTFGGTTYQAVSGSSIRIQNVDGTNSDLLLYQISSSPGLANLTIASASPTVGSEVIMVGNGRNRSDDTTQWWVDINPEPWVWSTSPFSGADGSLYAYAYAGGNAKRWGTNTVEGFETIDVGGSTYTFVTRFDASEGEAQGSGGDSGGGVFSQNLITGAWELSGIMSAIGYLAADKISIGYDLTYSVDLATYYDAIMGAIYEASGMNLIPEPATYAFWLAVLFGAGVLGWRGRFARR